MIKGRLHLLVGIRTEAYRLLLGIITLGSWLFFQYLKSNQRAVLTSKVCVPLLYPWGCHATLVAGMVQMCHVVWLPPLEACTLSSDTVKVSFQGGNI